jgi:hypothetical protein
MGISKAIREQAITAERLLPKRPMVSFPIR